MTPLRQAAALACTVACTISISAAQAPDLDVAYLKWTGKQVDSIGKTAYRRGRVGGLWDTRGLKTERAYNYKLAATWLTPEVIRATARMHQLRSRLSDDETRALVAEAEAAGGTVIIVDIDPREGSGVIPTDWEAFLQPKDAPDRALRGTVDRTLRDVKALGGVLRRNYDYDRFWVTFPLERGPNGTFGAETTAELVVRIQNQEGRVELAVPASLQAR
jgi:hypothetical protein